MSAAVERRLARLEQRMAPDAKRTGSYAAALSALAEPDLDLLIDIYQRAEDASRSVEEETAALPPGERQYAEGLWAFLAAHRDLSEYHALTDAQLDQKLRDLGFRVRSEQPPPQDDQPTRQSATWEVFDAVAIAAKLGRHVAGADAWASLYRGIAAANRVTDKLSPMRASFHSRFAGAAHHAREADRRGNIVALTTVPAELRVELEAAFAGILERHPDLSEAGRGAHESFRVWSSICDDGQLRINRREPGGGQLVDAPAAAMGVAAYLENLGTVAMTGPHPSMESNHGADS